MPSCSFSPGDLVQFRFGKSTVVVGYVSGSYVYVKSSGLSWGGLSPIKINQQAIVLASG